MKAEQDIKALKEKFRIESRSLKFRITELNNDKHHLETQIINLEFCLTQTIKNLTDKFKDDQDEEYKEQARFYNE